MTQKIYLFIFLILACNASSAQLQTKKICLNQLGFYPHASKIAVVVGEIPFDNFFITTIDYKDTVYHGKLSEQRQSKNSSLITHLADFGAFNKEGTYVVDIPGVGY